MNKNFSEFQQNALFFIIKMSSNFEKNGVYRLIHLKKALVEFVMKYRCDDIFFLYSPILDLDISKDIGEIGQKIDSYESHDFNLNMALRETFYLTTYIEGNIDKNVFLISDLFKDTDKFTVEKFKTINEINYNCKFEVISLYDNKDFCDLNFNNIQQLEEYFNERSTGISRDKT